MSGILYLHTKETQSSTCTAAVTGLLSTSACLLHFFVYWKLSPRRLLSANFINDFVAHFAAQLFAVQTFIHLLHFAALQRSFSFRHGPSHILLCSALPIQHSVNAAYFFPAFILQRRKF